MLCRTGTGADTVFARRGKGSRLPSVVGMNLPVIAGSISTVLFAMATLPMLLKAVRTRNMESYSFGHMAISNVANVVHSVYVFSLPPGPIWMLHAFYAVATALMLIWYLRFSRNPNTAAGNDPRTTGSGS